MKSFRLLPENLIQKIKAIDLDKEPLENVDPNVYNITAGLIEKFYLKDPELIGTDFYKTIEQLGLEEILSKLPQVTQSSIDTAFLKSLFSFKGTELDIKYLMKLAGVAQVTLVDSSGKVIVYNDPENIKYGVLNEYGYLTEYGKNMYGVPDCGIGLFITVDEGQDINTALIKEIIKKIMENRAYFCTFLAFLKIIFLFQDYINYKINEKITFEIYLTTKDNLNYEITDKVEMQLTSKVSKVYGRGFSYGEPAKDPYGNDVDLVYSDDDSIDIDRDITF